MHLMLRRPTINCGKWSTICSVLFVIRMDVRKPTWMMTRCECTFAPTETMMIYDRHEILFCSQFSRVVSSQLRVGSHLAFGMRAAA